MEEENINDDENNIGPKEFRHPDDDEIFASCFEEIQEEIAEI